MNREQQKAWVLVDRATQTVIGASLDDREFLEPHDTGCFIGVMNAPVKLGQKFEGDATPPATPEPPDNDRLSMWLSAMETGATHEQRRIAWNDLRDYFASQPPAASGDVERLKEAFRAGFQAGQVWDADMEDEALSVWAGDRPTPGGTK